jgi:hypothetical protein
MTKTRDFNRTGAATAIYETDQVLGYEYNRHGTRSRGSFIAPVVSVLR